MLTRALAAISLILIAVASGVLAGEHFAKEPAATPVVRTSPHYTSTTDRYTEYEQRRAEREASEAQREASEARREAGEAQWEATEAKLEAERDRYARDKAKRELRQAENDRTSPFGDADDDFTPNYRDSCHGTYSVSSSC